MTPIFNNSKLRLTCLIMLASYCCMPVFAARTAGTAAMRLSSASGSNTSAAYVVNWFKSYDNIRRQAQLAPQERQEADALLGKGMSILTPGPDKDAAQILLRKMVNNYQVATDAMQALPVLPETEALHKGYYEYFSTAKDLFGDYLTVQNNFFAQDKDGKPVMQSLLERKDQLEQINTYVHDLDTKIRAQYDIPPYQY